MISPGMCEWSNGADAPTLTTSKRVKPPLATAVGRRGWKSVRSIAGTGEAVPAAALNELARLPL
jgi:hypothetical protein